MTPPDAQPQAITLHRTYRYRIYPTRRQVAALNEQLGFACDLYNAALEQRRTAWRLRHRSVGFVDQCRDLTEVRVAGIAPEGMNCQAQRDPLHRLDRAFTAFFRRRQTGSSVGFPRYRSKARYDSLTWPWNEGARLIEDRLRLQGIGHLKIRWHRSLPIAEVRTVTVIRRARRWEIGLSLAVPAVRGCSSANAAVGLDVGILTFAALSTGELISGPRAYRERHRHIRLAERRLARRARGSRRRDAARRIVRRQHERIADLRRDHAHKTARDLITRFSTVFVEDLALDGLAKGWLAKDVHDQGWASFISILSSKAAEAGCTVIKVDPRGTSQRCSACGRVVPKELSVRVHDCPHCGYVADRDVNAARNVLGAGRALQALTDGVPSVA